jgi:hypothetical protein
MLSVPQALLDRVRPVLQEFLVRLAQLAPDLLARPVSVLLVRQALRGPLVRLRRSRVQRVRREHAVSPERTASFQALRDQLELQARLARAARQGPPVRVLQVRKAVLDRLVRPA